MPRTFGGEHSTEFDHKWRLPIVSFVLIAEVHQDPPERNILTDIHSLWTKSQWKKMKFETTKDTFQHFHQIFLSTLFSTRTINGPLYFSFSFPPIYTYNVDVCVTQIIIKIV